MRLEENLFSIKNENAVIKNKIPEILHLEHQRNGLSASQEKILSIGGENLEISRIFYFMKKKCIFM